MTAREVFERMAPLVAPAVEAVFDRRDCCILATRVAIEAARFFGIHAAPLPVKVIAYNAAFAKRVEAGTCDAGNPRDWGDGSWSVGIGCGLPHAPGRWDGHLIAVADDCFGDFSIGQAERLEHGIVTGSALVGPWDGAPLWKAVNDTGTVVEYSAIPDDGYWRGPDWKDEKRRRPIVGKLIRALREQVELSKGSQLNGQL